MAWNPSPEVAVARDAAQRLGRLAGTDVDSIVVLYITADARIGYVSYGRTRELCAAAKTMAELTYDTVVRAIESAP